jgi:hypothetical protein
MELREIKNGVLYWWQFAENDRCLVRARFISRDYVTCLVVAATAEQVIKSGYGVGEPVNTTPHALRPV